MCLGLTAFTDFKDVPIGLGDSNFFQLRPLAGKHGSPILFETLVNEQAYVFRGGDLRPEGVDLLVEILEMKFGEDAFAHQAVEVR